MKTETIQTERRKFKRFKIKEDVFAADSDRMGQIVDLSMGGLSFRYPELQKQPVESQEIDIFVKNNSFFLQNLPITIVSDCKVVDDIDYPMPLLRRRGVKFQELTSEQKFQLEYLLWTHHK